MFFPMYLSTKGNKLSTYFLEYLEDSFLIMPQLTWSLFSSQERKYI